MEVINTLPAQQNPTWAEQEDGKVAGFFLEDDPSITVVTWPFFAPGQAEEEVYHRALVSVDDDAQPSTPSIPRWLNPITAESEESKVAGFYLEDDPSYAVTTQPWWTAASFIDTEENKVAGFFLDDEPSVTVATWAFVVVVQAEEEVLARLGFGDEDSSLNTTTVVSWTPHPYYEQEDSKVAGFFLEDDPSFSVSTQSGWTPQSSVQTELLEHTVTASAPGEDSSSLNSTTVNGWTPQSYAEQEDGKVAGFYLQDEPSITVCVPPWFNPTWWESAVVAFPYPNGAPPSVALVTALGNAFLVLPQTIAIDANDVSERRPIVFNFKSDSVILAGDNLVPGQTVVFTQEPEAGQPALTLGGWTQAGNVVGITTAATGAQVNAEYKFVCRADTVGGDVLEKEVLVLIVGVG